MLIAIYSSLDLSRIAPLLSRQVAPRNEMHTAIAWDWLKSMRKWLFVLTLLCSIHPQVSWSPCFPSLLQFSNRCKRLASCLVSVFLSLEDGSKDLLLLSLSIILWSLARNRLLLFFLSPIDANATPRFPKNLWRLHILDLALLSSAVVKSSIAPCSSFM